MQVTKLQLRSTKRYLFVEIKLPSDAYTVIHPWLFATCATCGVSAHNFVPDRARYHSTIVVAHCYAQRLKCSLFFHHYSNIFGYKLACPLFFFSVLVFGSLIPAKEPLYPSIGSSTHGLPRYCSAAIRYCCNTDSTQSRHIIHSS